MTRWHETSVLVDRYPSKREPENVVVVSLDGIKARALQWASDLVNGFVPAADVDIDAIAKATNASKGEVRRLVGQLNDDDARPNEAEARNALAWLKRSQRGPVTLDAFRRYSTAAHDARAYLREQLGAHAGITKEEAEIAYKDLLSFAIEHPDVPMPTIAEAYITVLTALPIDERRDGYMSEAWYRVRDIVGRGFTDYALEGVRTAVDVGTQEGQSIQLAASIFASVIPDHHTADAKLAVNQTLNVLRRRYPSVPLEELSEAWLALQSAHGRFSAAACALTHLQNLAPDGADPSIAAWMRAYAIVYTAEGSEPDTRAAFELIKGAPEHLRKDPEALARAYTAVLKAEHDASTDAQHAFKVLLRWTPKGADAALMVRTFMALRDVVDHSEALARTLFIFETVGTPVRPAVLNKLLETQVAEARANRTLLGRLGTAVRELPQRAIGWWERPSNKAPANPARPGQAPESETAPTEDEAEYYDPETDTEEEAAPQPQRGGRRASPRAPTPSRTAGRLAKPLPPAKTPEGLAAYAPGSLYAPRTPECIDLFERAAKLIGVPASWAKSEGLHNILRRESGGLVGRPNYTYGAPGEINAWKAIHTDLKAGTIRAKSSATGIGQLLLRNVDVYYPAGRDGIGVPLQEAAGMLAYIKDRYGTPDRAWELYNTRHEGY